MDYKKYLQSNKTDFFTLHDYYMLNNDNKHKMELCRNLFIDEYKYEEPYALKINAFSIKKKNYDDFKYASLTLKITDYDYIFEFPIKLLITMENAFELNDDIIINFNWNFFFSNWILLQALKYKKLIFGFDRNIKFDVKLYIEKLYVKYTYESPMYNLYINDIKYGSYLKKLDVNEKVNGVFVKRNNFELNFTHNVAIDNQDTYFKTTIDLYKSKDITKSLDDMIYIDFNNIVSGNLNYELSDIIQNQDKKYNKGEIIFDDEYDCLIVKHQRIQFKHDTISLLYNH